jgi:antitoxin HicB
MGKYDSFSTVDDMLEEDGILEVITAEGAKRAFILEIQDAMKAANIGKSDLARRMDTSRAQLDRLLSFEATGVSIESLVKLSHAVGRRLEFRLV